MKDAIYETLVHNFGPWETTKELMDDAVTTFMSDIHDVKEQLRAQAKQMGMHDSPLLRKQATLGYAPPKVS